MCFGTTVSVVVSWKYELSSYCKEIERKKNETRASINNNTIKIELNKNAWSKQAQNDEDDGAHSK